MSPIKILLAEDHKIVREGARQLLEQASDLVVVGEAESGEEAVQLAGTLQPDVVVMDLRMPGLNGLEATRQIRAAHAGVRVLMLSAYEAEQYVVPALEAGADGYLLKTVGGRELAQAIRNVHHGQTVLDPQVAGLIVGRLASRRLAAPDDGSSEPLTGREMQVLQALADGKSNKEIADQLLISTYTVQVHLRNIFGKLGVSSRTEAVTYALRRGWIALDGPEP